ncbi:hypothetical protein AAVH_08811 [Aphelenchoides avenae]|nr:hypothetical protein AAVH_08811 [Aphelenchus avenae]
MFNNPAIDVDVFSLLGRDVLEAIQLSRLYFYQIIAQHMSTVCWRRIGLADLQGLWDGPGPGVMQYTAKVKLGGDSQTYIDHESKEFEEVTAWLTNAIRCSFVESLDLTRLLVTPTFVNQLLTIRETFEANVVTFFNVDFALVSASLLHSLLVEGLVGMRSFTMKICLNMTSAHLDDSLLKTLMEKRVFKLSLVCVGAPDGQYYNISMDTILEFCFGHEQCASVSRVLDLSHVRVPPDFCDTIVERRKHSALKSHLQLKIEGVRVEEQRLEHYYRNRKVIGGLVVFDFLDDGQVPLQLNFWREELQLTVFRGDD